jgi:parallel beta-helix repeat protein
MYVYSKKITPTFWQNSKLVAVLGLSITALAALATLTGTTPKPVAAETCTPWAGENRLQDAVNLNACIEIQPGIYTITEYLVVPDGHTIRGNPAYPRSDMVLKPGATWNGNGMEAVINGQQPPHTTPVNLPHFTVDGLNVSTGGVGAANMNVNDMVVRGARCWGVGIVGPAMRVTNNLIEHNGASTTCPSAPGAGIYVAANGVEYAEYAPFIQYNEIRNNTGPGIDIYNVWRGDLQYNNIHDNTSWAGVSLLGSYWTVANNTVVHPQTAVGQPWIPSCSGGPKGAHSSAIFLCQATIAGGVSTINNKITTNKVSSWYGVLLIGNDEANASAVPRFNTITGNTTTGSQLPCADDFKRNGTGKNTWSGCTPTYF